MPQEIMSAFSLDWRLIVVDFTRVAIAFLLALPIGYERARSQRSIGLRTFPIVAIASCGYMLVAIHIAEGNPDTMMRALQGLLGGIGFIGGGAILKENGSIYGMATAASLWNTGAAAAAVAFDRVEIAVILCLLNFVLMRLLSPVVYGEEYSGPLGREDEGAEEE